MTTLRDIASEIGCSTATVSRALNDDRRISSTTREAVHSAAQRLGYEPNRVARALRRGDTQLIGIVVPTLDNHRYSYEVALMSSVLDSSGYGVLVACHNESRELERRAVRRLVDQRVDGVIHMPASNRSFCDMAGEFSAPVIELVRSSGSDCVDAVYEDSERVGYAVAKYLIELGHSRIALVSGRSLISTNNLRRRGFERAVVEAGLDKNACPVIFGASSVNEGRSAATKLLKSGPTTAPTAVFVTTARSSVGLLVELRQQGIPIPAGMSVVGLSNPEWYEVCAPPLTSYELPLEEMGSLAVQLLLTRITGKAEKSTPIVVWFAGQMIVRESAAPLVG